MHTTAATAATPAVAAALLSAGCGTPDSKSGDTRLSDHKLRAELFPPSSNGMRWSSSYRECVL